MCIPTAHSHLLPWIYHICSLFLSFMGNWIISRFCYAKNFNDYLNIRYQMHTYKSFPRVFIAYFIKFKMLCVVRYTPLFCTTKKEIFSIKQYHNAFLLPQCISISELLNLKKMCFRINEIEYLGVGVLGQRKCTTSNLLESIQWSTKIIVGIYRSTCRVPGSWLLYISGLSVFFCPLPL